MFKSSLFIFAFLLGLSSTDAMGARHEDDFDKLLNADGLVKLALLDLQNYFVLDLKLKTVVHFYPEDHFRVYSSKDGKSLKTTIHRERNGDELTEVLVFSSPGNPSGSLTLRRTGPHIEETPDSDLFELRLPGPSTCASYNLTLNGGNVAFYFENKNSEIRGHMRFNFQGIIFDFGIISYETPEEKMLRYSLYYSLVTNIADATAREEKIGEDSWNTHYFFTGNPAPISSADFLTWYNSIIGGNLEAVGGLAYNVYGSTRKWPDMNLIQISFR